METESRRAFNRKLLGSLTAFGLIETLVRHDLFADEVKPIIERWVARVNELSKDLKGHRVSDIAFQAQLEELYKRVDLTELIKLVQLDANSSRTDYVVRSAPDGHTMLLSGGNVGSGYAFRGLPALRSCASR